MYSNYSTSGNAFLKSKKNDVLLVLPCLKTQNLKIYITPHAGPDLCGLLLAHMSNVVWLKGFRSLQAQSWKWASGETFNRVWCFPQSSCPVMRRRKRPTTPAREASTDWTAFPLDPPTPLTPLRCPPEAGWKRRWRASQSRRRWTWTSLKKWWARSSRYLGERGWKIRWDVVGCFWGSSDSSCSFTADNWCFSFFSSTVWESTSRAVLTEDEETQIRVQPVRQHHPGVSERKSGISTQDGDEARRRESLQFL